MWNILWKCWGFRTVESICQTNFLVVSKERAAIARALANRPSLILADEPTGALDSKNGNEVINLLQNSVKQLNQTLVLITHNLDLAREADRIIKLADGEIVE